MFDLKENAKKCWQFKNNVYLCTRDTLNFNRVSMKKRLFMMAVVLLMMSLAAIAQVTTSGITGVVKAGGEEAIGATITAKDTRSGAVYRAVTNIDGRYTITGMRAGGPYEVEVSYIGFQTSKITNLQLQLGQNSVVDADLSDDSGDRGCGQCQQHHAQRPLWCCDQPECRGDGCCAYNWPLNDRYHEDDPAVEFCQRYGHRWW